MSLKRCFIFMAFLQKEGKMNQVKKTVLAGLLLAIGMVLPFVTGQIPQIGSMLLPMHIPVLLCGFICGWKYGLVAGITAPLLRSLTLSMPPIFPTATCMAFELAAYGALAGLLYNLLPKKKLNIYVSLLSAMIIGRIIWGLAMLICLNINGGAFTFTAFLSGAIINALPGIIIQIILIPILIMALENVKVLNMKN